MRFQVNSYELVKQMIAGALPEDDACLEWPRSRLPEGYGRIRHKGKTLYAHRIALELTRGPLPAGVLALHKCDNPACFRPDHLFAGTPADNTADCISKSRFEIALNPPRGSARHGAKLTEANVREIRRLRSTGALIRDIAEQYGVSETAISNACRGFTWDHVSS